MSITGKLNVVKYHLTLNGKDATWLFPYIKFIDYEQRESDSDRLSLTIDDPNRKFIDDGVIVIDTSIELYMGWANDQQRIHFKGWISLMDINFDEKLSPTVIIHCMDRFHELNKQNRKQTWKKVRASDVVRQIASRYGLNPIIDPTRTVEDTITQSYETDATFLVSLAAKEQDPKYVCYIEGNNLYFIKRRWTEKEQAVMTYGSADGQIFTFNPRIIKEKISIPVEVATVSPKTKKPEKSKPPAGGKGNGKEKPTPYLKPTGNGVQTKVFNIYGQEIGTTDGKGNYTYYK